MKNKFEIHASLDFLVFKASVRYFLSDFYFFIKW